MATADTARLVAELTLKDKLSGGVRTATASVDKLDKRLGKVGSSTKRLAGGLGKAALVGIGAVGVGLAASAKAAIAWEDAFQGVVKTLDLTTGNPAHLTFDQISDSLRAMSLEMPIAATELAAIAEAGGAMGIKAKDIEEFTRQVAILATTTNVSADDAATALGQLGTQIGLTGDEFDNFAAALVDLGNKGNSTEAQILDIEKRAGGFASSAGLAKDAALGWAAATANIFGDRTEMGGTALAKFFNTALSAIGGGGKKLEAFAKIAGVGAKQFQKQFGKDASGALQKFIKGLSKLKGAERLAAIQKLFGKGTGVGKLINDLANGIDKNLTPSLETATKAWFEGAAAQEEFNKRNETVRSAMTRLKNGVIDAAVSIGEGMVPALGRAADRLATFLKDPAIRKQLEGIGKDIGAAIDSIDWGKLLDTARSLASAFKPALDVILKIADTIAKLPPGVIGGAGALILTDKVTGGAISGGVGGIVGGLGESLAKNLAAKIPIFGAAFVQHVWVDNLGGLPLPGPGGKLPTPGGGNKLPLGGPGTKLGATAGIFIADMHEFNADLATRLEKNDSQFAQTLAERLRERSETDTPWDKILIALGLATPRNPSGNNGMPPGSTSGPTSFSEPGIRAIEAAKLAQVTAIRETGSTTGTILRESSNSQELATEAVKQATKGVDSTARSGLAGTTGAVNTARAAITGAIVANRPIVTTTVEVNVTPTGVQKQTTTQTRYGPINGSQGGGTGTGSGHKYD